MSLCLCVRARKGVQGVCEGRRECLREIGASLSEPHTSGTALRKCVNVRACLLAAIYRKF